MGTVHQNLLRLKRAAGLTAALLALARPAPAQMPPGLGEATDFTSVEYYSGAFQLQMKTRVHGETSRPAADSPNELEVTGLRIENYTTNGILEAVVTAPHCLYSTTDSTARDAGPILVQSGDGKSRLTGTGFLWRQSPAAKFLTISNDVTTIISESALPASLKKP